MKKQLLLVVMAVLCLCPKPSNAQTNEQNLKNYWENRDRLRKFFVKIGPNQGESMVANIRDRTGNTMRWADGTSQLGFYIAVLATEYELLKRDGQPTQGTLNELYFAINAVKRLDKFGEYNYARKINFDGSIGEMENGWFLRDDVDSTLQQNWGRMGIYQLHSDFFNKDDPDNDQFEHFSTGNEPSLDQTICLLIGFRFVQKFVGDIYVDPLGNNTGFSLFTECKNITKRIRDRLLLNKDFAVNPYSVNNSRGFRPQNYTFTNPLYDYECGDQHDRWIFFGAYPLMTVMEAITGEQVYQTFNFKYFNTITNAETDEAMSFEKLHDIYDDIIDGISFSVYTYGGGGTKIAEWLTDDVNIVMNMRMAIMMEAIGDMSNTERFKELCVSFNKPIYSIMQEVLYDRTTSNWDRDFYKSKLDLMTPEGSYLYSENVTNDPPIQGNGGYWSWDNRWIINEVNESHDWAKTWIKGNQPGLDYMLMYNLYHLAFDNQQNLPVYTPEVICPEPSVKFHEISNTRNNGQWLGQTELVLPTGGNPHILTNYWNVYHYDFDAEDYGIKYERYLAKNLIIQGGGAKLQLLEDVKVCNNSYVELVLNGSRLVVGNNPDTPSVLRFTSGSVLKLKPNTNLEVLANSKVIIEEGATLEYYAGATIDLKGVNSVLEIRGNLVLMADANFKTIGDGFVRFNIPTVNNSPNITVNGNNCQMLFESTNIGDKRIEVSSNTNLYPPANLKLFKLENSTAHLGVKAGVFLPCDFHIVGNTITRIPNVVDNSISGGGTRIHNGITIYAISHTQTISDNTFSDGKKALTLLNPQGFYDIKVHYNDFTNCDMGIQIRNGRSHIFANSFLDCGQAVQALDYARSIRFESNFVGGSNNTETGFGFEITSPNYGEVAIAGNAFNNTITGFHADKAVATLQCNYFYHNQQAIDALHSGNLNISSIVPSSSISLANGNPLLGGYNYFNIPTNKKGIRVTTPWYLVSPNFLNSYINEGFNSFSNDNAGNYNHPSWETNRPTNTLSTISPDIIINNNYWGQQATTYTPPSSPYNYIDVNHGASIHFKIDENYTPRYILGTNSTSTTTCPVSDWTDALTNPQSFNPNTKRPPSGNGPVINSVRKGSTLGGFNGSYGGTNTTQNVPSGAYSGINVKTAFQTVFNGFSQEVPIAGGGTETQVTLQGLLNLSALLNATIQLTSPEVKSMNVYGYQKYLSGMGDAIGAGAFIDNPNGKSSQLAAANALFNKILLINDQTNTSDTPHYQMKFQTELDRMIVNWMFGEYSNALSINDYISTFVRSEEQDRLSYWNCVIENERKVMSNEITALEYAQNTSTCALLYPYSPELWYGINSAQGGSGSSSTPSISYTLSPNPATTTITVSMNLTIDADVNIAVFNKFGVKVVSDIDMGSLLAGNHNQAVLISGLPADVYNMAVYVNGVPYVEHFIKQTE